MFNPFRCCAWSLGPFPDNIHAPRQCMRPQLSSHSADPTSASSTTFPPFHTSLPIQIQRSPPDRSTASPKSPTPTTDNPIPPAISLFRDICFIEWLSLSPDFINRLVSSVFLYLGVLNCGAYYRSCFPEEPSMTSRPTTTTHSCVPPSPPPCIMATTLTSW